MPTTKPVIKPPLLIVVVAEGVKAYVVPVTKLAMVLVPANAHVANVLDITGTAGVSGCAFMVIFADAALSQPRLLRTFIICEPATTPVNAPLLW